VTNGLLSKASTEALLAKLRRVANEFTEKHHTEANLPLTERRPLSMVLAVRPWELEEMRALRRRAPEKANGQGRAKQPEARTPPIG